MLDFIVSIPFFIISIVWFCIKFCIYFVFIAPIIVSLELYLYYCFIDRFFPGGWQGFVNTLFSVPLRIVFRLRRPYMYIRFVIYQNPAIMFNFPYFWDFICHMTSTGAMIPITIYLLVRLIIYVFYMMYYIFYFVLMPFYFMYKLIAQWIRRLKKKISKK